ncbi:hypothetical protein HHI36_012389 [Cryptolaemus montrouzieri]|uniref:1-acylglycerol-3-phosphate O-acyltransferase n=1 Tax=Cryptolaemus montrouzieri TaxID=559131 RepID=A0ABD2NEB3_9CUCU
MFHLWPSLRSATAVAKKELVYFVPFGPCLYASRLLFIPRSQSEKSKKILNDAVEIFKKENTHIWLFPEGTRRSDGQIHEFKKGGFHMALSAHLPILPIVYGAYDFINHKEKRFDSGKQVINILPPISTKGKSIEDLDALIKETRSKMIENYNEINNKKFNSVKS